MSHIIGKISNCHRKSVSPNSEETDKFFITYYEGTESGYHSNDQEIIFKKDGAIYLSDPKSEDFIYLYPEQVEYLKKLLSTEAKS